MDVVYLLVAMCDNDNRDDISRIVCHARDADHAAEVTAFAYAQWDGVRQAMAEVSAARDAAALATRDPSRPELYSGGGHPCHEYNHPCWAALGVAAQQYSAKFKELTGTVMDPGGYDSSMAWRPIYRVLAVPAAPALPSQSEALLTLMNSDQGDPEPT